MNTKAHTTIAKPQRHTRRTTAWLVSLAILTATSAGVSAQVMGASPAQAAPVVSCPGGTDDSLRDERRATARSIAQEAVGEPRLIISDAKIVVSESPSFEASIGAVTRYSVYAGSVVEVAANRKYLGAGWGRVSIKTSASTGCAWALVSDQDLRGGASYWIDIAPDADHTESWVGLVSPGYYEATGHSSTYGPTVPVPDGGAVRACAKFAADGDVTFCSAWSATS